MTKAQEFSVKVQSEDPEKKEKPEGKGPDPSAVSKSTKKDKKEGEELVRILSQDLPLLLTMFSVRRGSTVKGSVGYAGRTFKGIIEQIIGMPWLMGD